MVCSAYDSENDKCTKLGQKFYKGMQKPCENVTDPSQCPLVLMRGG